MSIAVRKPFVLGIVCLLISSFALAQNIRSAVSLSGSDLATCTVPDPCRTFDVALGKTNEGGEVIVLSSGGYGPFTVTTSSVERPNTVEWATPCAVPRHSVGLD